MQSAISIQQAIMNGVGALPESKQQEVLDFVEFLRQKVAASAESRLSMQEIAKLPIRDRHQLLRKYIPAMAEDFANDPALTEFSDLDMDDWAEEDVEA